MSWQWQWRTGTEARVRELGQVGDHRTFVEVAPDHLLRTHKLIDHEFTKYTMH